MINSVIGQEYFHTSRGVVTSFSTRTFVKRMSVRQ